LVISFMEKGIDDTEEYWKGKESWWGARNAAAIFKVGKTPPLALTG
jgi:hypothetical protein